MSTQQVRALVLWADDRLPNLGVRVLASGNEALVTSAWPGAIVEFQNFGHKNPRLPIGSLRSMARERVTGKLGTLDWLASFDIVLDTRAGDSFADIYGLKRHRTMSAVSELASQAGTPVVLSPQTIGPFTTRQGRALARRSLSRSAISMARDSHSADYARSIGRPIDVLTTDVAFALPVPKVAKSRDVLLNVSGLLWQDSPHVDSLKYRETILRLYRELTEQGREVSLLAHVLDSPSADNDVPAIREFAGSTDQTPEVLIPRDLDDVRSMVASAELVIGSRMHACLNALSVGTPAIPLAYSRKFHPLMSDLGWTRTVDLREAADPMSDILASVDELADDPSQAASVKARAQELLKQAATKLRGVL